MKTKPDYLSQYAHNSFKLLEAIIERHPRSKVQEYYRKTRLSLEFLGSYSRLKSPPIRRHRSLHGTIKIYEGPEVKGEVIQKPMYVRESFFEELPS